MFMDRKTQYCEDVSSSYLDLWIQCNSFLFCNLLAALGLRCFARAFSSCSERELLFVVVCGLLIAVASLVAEHVL